MPRRALVSDQRVDPSDGFPPVSRSSQATARESGRADASQGVERLDVLVQVAGVRQAVDDRPAHHALLVDDEGAAHRAALLLVEDAVGARGLAVRPEVRQQRVLQALLLGEDPQGVDGVVGDGEQLDVVVRRTRQLVAQRAQLAGAHAGEGERVEEQHHVLLAAEVGEPHGARRGCP